MRRQLLWEGNSLGDGVLGHDREECDLVPRLVEVRAGKRVVGASAGDNYTMTSVDRALHLWAWRLREARPRNGEED